MMLTIRQMQVLKAMAEGLTASETACHLHLSESAVKDHLTQARRKLEAKNTAHAIALAMRTGVIQ